MKVYLVAFDGWLAGYGSSIYLLGIYDNENKANEIAESFNKKYKDDFIEAYVEEVDLNHTYDEERKEDWGITTPICLGCYIE